MSRSHNDLVYEIALRASQLSSMKMRVLRSTAGYDCETEADAIRSLRHHTRGELVDIVLTEEFCLEFDLEFESS